ncbi:hypothetical protein M8J76_007324 [Diaphorina citri]|nr:hypothetical protein M8J76_007324 [Diaphorina citri]KAI5746764.1 hypothetical protein M8J77_007233 [Diaphorina citri]
MEESKSKSNKNINEHHDTNFQYHIRPKPRTRRKTKPHPSNELPQNRGLYSAISESSMCYPMSPLPPAIPIEHHASVSFLPIYQPSCCSSYQCFHHTKPQQSPVMPTNMNLNKKPVNAKYLTSVNANDSFTSLPPAIPFSGEDSPTQRRFSDPGLGNDEISITSDDTREADEILEESNELTSLDFEEEMITLKKDYCKLSRELSKTKKELAFVKSIVQNQNVHSPLLITDIIKEIQNAADAREEAFMARVQSIVDQSSIAQTPPPKLDCSSCKSVLERLEAVESQIKQLSLNSDQKKTTNLFEELRIGGGVKSTGYTGSNDTGYTSSNGLNPFAFSRESSVSPSTEL